MPPSSRSTRASPKEWQFVSVNDPKQNLDKGAISMVRAHAMRSVRRQQRLKLTTQHQKSLKTKVPTPPAYPTVAAEPLVPIARNDGSVDEEANTDWFAEMSSELELVDFSHTTSDGKARLESRSDDEGRRPDYWQIHREIEGQEPTSFALGIHRTGSPRLMYPDGVFDPFNTMRTAICADYNSHVLHHFVTVMALNCVPVDQGKGQNSLTKDWLLYAFRDSTLFLATMTFAEVHLGILSGNHRSERTLARKCDSIKAVNAMLRDRAHALSNEAIGAVAMLAAIESILGNYDELRIHMKGLQRMVHLRGGPQNLGWGGVLQMFISWQDLLYSATLAAAPRVERTPCCRLIRGSLPHNNPVFHDIGLSTELAGGIATSFQNMRYLSQRLNDWALTPTTLEMMSFTEMRTAVVHRLLSLANQKPALKMTSVDYHIELCRLAALIYIKIALHMYMPLCATSQGLKRQLINLIKQGEANGATVFGCHPQPLSVTWALFVGGIISLNKGEEEWFARRLAKGARASGVEAWAEMEARLRTICWQDKLNTQTCMSLWRRVENIHAEYWAAKVCDVPSRWDRTGWYYDS